MKHPYNKMNQLLISTLNDCNSWQIIKYFIF
uniref:Uncharacterized protein n=1 Tax=Lepeophtheirus salmonis TaxID=72036 RepID=A0A0K2V2E4_LEPSM